MIKVYSLKEFNASLALKPYCSNDLTKGLKIRTKEQAIKHKYIQVNDNYIKCLVIDLDHANPLIWEEAGLPAPNFIVRDKVKNTSHLIWCLDSPIYKDYIHKAKNLAYFAKIQQAFTERCNGDKSYVGLIAKNPNSPAWLVGNINRFYAYSLDELADYVILPERITKKSAIGEGRNCWLFDTVRKWAYREVLFYKQNQATFEDFYNVVLNRLDKLNIFPSSQPLEFNEIKATAKSIAKWTWAKFNPEKFSQIQKARRQQRKDTKQLNILKEELKNEFS